MATNLESKLFRNPVPEVEQQLAAITNELHHAEIGIENRVDGAVTQSGNSKEAQRYKKRLLMPMGCLTLACSRRDRGHFQIGSTGTICKSQ